MWSTSASASVDLPGAFPSATAAAPGVGIGIGIAAPWSSAIVCCTGGLPSLDDDSNSHFPPGDGAAHASTPPSAPPTLFVAALAGDAGNSPATADSAAGGGTATPTTSKNPSSSTPPACVVAPAPEPAGPPPAFASACPACLARLLLEGALAAPLPAERSSAGRLSAEMRPLARTSCSSSAYAALATCRSAARDTGSNSSESEGSSAPAAPDNRAWQCACATVTNTAPHKGKAGRAHTRGGGRGTRAHARDGWVDGSVRQSVMVQYRALAADRYAAREHRRRTVASFRCCETAAGRAANFRRQRRATCCRHCSLILGSIRQYTCLVICSPAIVICAGC